MLFRSSLLKNETFSTLKLIITIINRNKKVGSIEIVFPSISSSRIRLKICEWEEEEEEESNKGEEKKEKRKIGGGKAPIIKVTTRRFM